MDSERIAGHFASTPGGATTDDLGEEKHDTGIYRPL